MCDGEWWEMMQDTVSPSRANARTNSREKYPPTTTSSIPKLICLRVYALIFRLVYHLDS